MSGIQDNQVFDAAADTPISANVYFALIAGVEPSVLQNAGSFFRAVPVARENMRPAHNDLFAFSQLHLDSGNHRADVARLDGHARVIERANAGGFREPVCLEHRNTEHQKKLLRLRSERCGTADQSPQVRAKALSNLSKDEAAASGARLRKQGTDNRRPFGNGFFDAAPATLKQRGNIQEIIRRGQTHFVGKLVEIGRKSKNAFAREAR